MENSRKRRRMVMNKLVENATSFNQKYDRVNIMANELVFNIPNEMNKSQHHIIKINICKHGNLTTECTCYPNNKKNIYCKHVNSAIISFISKFIKSTQEGYDHTVTENEMNHKINNLTECLENIL